MFDSVLSLRFGYEIYSMAILSPLMILVEPLLVIGERMCTEYWLTTDVKPAQGNCC